MARLSVIIVNFNSGDRLARCLDCLATQQFRDFEIIVFDNASSDGSIRRAKAEADAIATPLAGELRFIESDENLGFAAGNNRTAEAASGEMLVFLNPDAYAHPDWLAKLVDASKRYPEAGAFGSTQLNAADPAELDGAGDVFHIFGLAYRGGFGAPSASLPPEGECFAPCAAAAMYRAAQFRELQGFDERFFCYGEDVDLGFRLRLSGGKIMQIPSAIVLHEGSGVTGRRSAFTVYHGHRNRIWLWWKNTPAALLPVSAPLNLVLTILLGVQHMARGEGKSYWNGVLDGLKGLPRFNADRANNLNTRRVSVSSLARVIAWSPLELVRRAPKIVQPR